MDALPPLRFLPTLAVALLAAACSAPADARGDLSSGGAARCPLHDTPLVEEEVDVVYGLIREPADEEQTTRAELFPNALVAPQGGCVVGDETAVVRHCPACTERHRAWEAARELLPPNRDDGGPAPLESGRRRP